MLKFQKRLIIQLKIDHSAVTSDEIEAGISVLEFSVDDWWGFAWTTTFTNKSSKSVSISNARWFFYSSRYIVIGVAKFVSQRLNLVRRCSDRIV